MQILSTSRRLSLILRKTTNFFIFVASGCTTMVKKRNIKLFCLLLESVAILYLSFTLCVLIFQLLSNNPIVNSRNCVCQSMDTNLQVAFSKGGSKSYNFRCPMTINYLGRLGNSMGQYATLLALAPINGHAPYLQKSMKDELNKYFDTSIPVVNQKVYNTSVWTEHEIHDWMSDEYSEFGCNFTEIAGFPNSWTFFHHIRDDVKREFRFKHNFVHDAQTHLESLRKSENTTFIGVHVRRDDYVPLMKYLYNGVLANSEFFTEAMNYFRSQFKDCVFVVCSDDLNWCKKNIDNSLRDVHFCWNGNSRSSGRDMALLTQCNHSIITVGTFSFWVAYLTGGQVVYFNNYLRNDSFFLKKFLYNSSYLPEWISIDADL